MASANVLLENCVYCKEACCDATNVIDLDCGHSLRRACLLAKWSIKNACPVCSESDAITTCRGITEALFDKQFREVTDEEVVEQSDINKEAMKIFEELCERKRLLEEKYWEITVDYGFSVPLVEHGESRVMVYSEKEDLLIVPSRRATNPNGFGLKRIKIQQAKNEYGNEDKDQDQKKLEQENEYDENKVNVSFKFIEIHEKPIKDLKLHEEEPLILSVSLDKTAQIIDILNGKVLSKCTLPAALYSCDWSLSNVNLYFVGDEFGKVHVITRTDNSILKQISFESQDPSPILSVISLPFFTNTNIDEIEFICCTENNIWSCLESPETTTNYSTTKLPIEGPFLSVTTCKSLPQRLLITCKPMLPYHERVCFLLADIFPKEEDADCFEIIKTIQGPRQINSSSRSCLFNYEGNEFIAAYHPVKKNVVIWDAEENKTEIQIKEDVFDICHIQSNKNYLACLCDEFVHFFQLDVEIKPDED